ncbi:MAG: SpvB/TcaC N-terminal domain-containing protein [Bacteroidota bacterium]
MRSIKYNILAFLFLINLGSISAQTATLTISSPTPVGQYQARDLVKVTPSGKIIANSTTGSRLFIDPNMILPVVYSNPGANGVSPVVPVLNLAKPIGSIPYTYNVTPIGSASCNIPVFIPLGTNGMQPGVSLSYSSLNTMGQLGCGWDISGISEISRSNKTIYHDSIVKAVNLTNADPFSLDGNRLIPTTGANGASNTVYGTEVETFSRITSYNTIGSGPEWFKVETKEGMTLEYGKNADARLIPVGQMTVLTWKINKMYDTHGNYILFNYNNQNGEVFIKEILYTGNANIALAPYNSIKFYYDLKQTTNSTFVSGGELNHTTLLRAIEIKADGLFTKQYNFKYSQYHVNYYLTEVEEVGSDYSVLNPLKFSYDLDNGPSTNTNVITKTPSVMYSQDLLLDFTGDGIKDLVSLNYDFINSTTVWFDWSSYKNIGNSNFQSTSTGNSFPVGFEKFDAFPVSPSVAGNMVYESIDFNGDSKEDLMLLTVGGSGATRTLGFNTFLSNGTIFSPTGAPISVTVNSTYKYWYCDVNGDQKMDLVVYSFGGSGSTDLYIYYELNSSNVYHTSYSGTSNPDLRNAIVLDIDGDGVSEFANVRYLSGGPAGDYIIKFVGGIASFIADNSAITYYSSSYLQTGNSIAMSEPFHLFGDFNGDGKSDNIFYDQTSATTSVWKMGLGKGNGVYKDIPLTSIFPVLEDGKYFLAHDINKDGKTDILEFINGSFSTTTNVKVYYSTGLSFIVENFTIDMSGFSKQLGDLKFGDFNGDGTDDLFIGGFGSFSPSRVFYFNRGAKSNNIDEIYDGNGKKVKFDFTPLTIGSSLYSKTTGFTYPLSEFQNALYVVNQTNVSDGIGGINTTNYSYQDAILHKQGKGLLGFKKVTTTNIAQDVITAQLYNFNTTFFNVFTTSSLSNVHSLGTPISSSTFQNTTVSLNGGKTYLSKTDNITTTDHIAGFTKTEDYLYNVNGNLTSRIVNINAGAEITTVTNTYIQQGAWIPNKLLSSQSNKIRTGELPYTRKMDYSYNNFGDLVSASSDLGTSKSVTTDFINDANTGVKLQSTVSSGALASKVTHWDYDQKFRDILKSYNTLNQITEYTYDHKWAKPLKIVGVDGLATVYNYDAFGKIVNTRKPDGNETNIVYSWVQPGEVAGNEPVNVSNSLYKTTSTETGKPYTKTMYDSYGRILKKETEGFSNNLYKVYSYDSRGRLYKESSTYQIIVGNPFTPLITTYNYNNYNQPTQITTTDGTVYQNSYMAYTYNSGNTTVTSTSPDNKITTVTTDPTRLTIGATDGGGSLVYEYYSNHKPKRVKLNGVQMNYMEYDEIDNQSKLTDKDAGTTLYTYNAYGQMVSKTDANGQTSQYDYDLLGRLSTKTTSSGTYTHLYVTSGNGINQLLQATAPNGITRTYNYDNLNRNTQYSENISGNLFSTAYEYDQYNNVTKITYPSSFAIKKEYNNKGFLVNIKRNDNSDLIWQRDEVSPIGTETKFTLGNQIQSVNTYDNFGHLTNMYASGVQNLTLNFNALNDNLNYRTDNIKGLTENFTYDNLNRLTQSLVAGSSAPIDLTYNSGGSITQKTDIGTTSFHASKAHATETATNPNTNISLTQQTITYTPFNKAQTIIEGDYQYNLMYGTTDQRRKAELYYQGSLSSTKFYHLNYEKEISSTSTKQIHYINGLNGLCAMYVIDNGVGTMYYIYNDHLGSINTITDASGNIVTEQNFDAWGRKRNTTYWSYNSIGSTPNWLYRGFTGHEHLPQFSLINMNGRLYDPLLSSMLSPDKYNQQPIFTQNYNRYGYAYNNPLKYTDPSGDFILRWLIGAVKSWVDGGSFQQGLANGERELHNDIKLGGGLFAWDQSYRGKKSFRNDLKNIGENFVQAISHTTFELPQTLLGYHHGMSMNLVGDVGTVRVKYYHGATVIYGGAIGDGAGMTLGSYISLSKTDSDNQSNLGIGFGSYTTMHEYGHYLQSRKNGGLYLFKFAIPSLGPLGYMGGDDPGATWTENDANLRSAKYFNKVDNNFNWDVNFERVIWMNNHSSESWDGPSDYALLAKKETNGKWWEQLSAIVFWSSGLYGFAGYAVAHTPHPF